MRYNLRVIPYICSRYAEKGLSAVSIHRGASSFNNSLPDGFSGNTKENSFTH